MEADISNVLGLLRAAHAASSDEHIQLSGLRACWPSAVFDADEPEEGKIRTGSVRLSIEEFLAIDDSTIAGLSSLFDGCRLWFVCTLPDEYSLVVEDVLGKPWLREPRVFLAPLSSGPGQVCVIRAKFDFCPGGDREMNLPVSLFSFLSQMDKSCLKSRSDNRMTTLRMSPGRRSRLPSRSKVLSIIELKSGLEVPGIEVTELGSAAEIEVISRSQVREDGVTGCCFYSVSSGYVMMPVNASACLDESIIRIEVSSDRLMAGYVGMYLNNHARVSPLGSIEEAVVALMETPILIPPLEAQAAISHFNSAHSAYQEMLQSSLSGFGSMSVIKQINTRPDDLFQASVYYDGLVEAGSRHGAGTLPYALSCSYRAYECAPRELKMERAFKMIDAFVEFHCLCGISLAAAFFDPAAARRLGELYNRSKLFQLGGWRDEFSQASSAYRRIRGSREIGELLRLTKVLGAASIYALDQMYSIEVDELLKEMIKLRNTFDAHGPTWGSGESAKNEAMVAGLIEKYTNLTLSLWGHLRLGYCSSVTLNSSNYFESLIERCGHEGFGKSGMLFTTQERLACPGSLVLYSSAESAVFVSLLPFNYVKKIAPSLHVIYNLSRTEGTRYTFNSFAALESGISAREILEVNDPAAQVLTDFLKKHPIRL
jgi:hypothetical protein